MANNQDEAPPVSDETGLTPVIVSPDCAAHMEWLKKVLGAKQDGEMYFMPEDYETAPEWNKGGVPGKRPIVHAPMRINGAQVLMADNVDHQEKIALVHEAPVGHGYMMNVPAADPDALWAKAMEAGAREHLDLKVQYWGNKFGIFVDPYGYKWAVSQAR